jgi:trehalose 6-phosphate synthase/phosphatase
VLVGKKNLEVRPIAVNKGEIVKRILYMNPDAEFIFCAGDDKVCRHASFSRDLSVS